MSQEPGALVSVIVTTRNSARTLDECLRSIKDQDHRPLELIVVDNRSTDGTVEIARRLADAVADQGPERSAQRNRGARIARGDYLLFIDSDMKLDRRVVSDCVELQRASGAPAVVIPEYSVGEGFIARCRAFERTFYVGDDSVEAARFFTRAAFEASGGFDEELTGPEDWDLSLRIAQGRHLPRTANYIEHDEGRLSLATVMGKKRYYAGSSMRYMRKHGRGSVGQGNLILRPAFVRGWRRMARHPVLAAGVISLKSLETAAVGWGMVQAWARERSRPTT